jgi:hypothetical protein
MNWIKLSAEGGEPPANSIVLEVGAAGAAYLAKYNSKDEHERELRRRAGAIMAEPPRMFARHFTNYPNGITKK